MARTLSEAIELIVGILAFFALMAIVVTVVYEVRGEDALTPALVSAGLLAVIGVLWWLRGKASRKSEKPGP